MGIDDAKRPAVFLDRDGVINRPIVRDGRPYPPRSVAEFELLPGVPAACEQLKRAGYLLVVATNQPDVGRGTLSRIVVEAIHERMHALLPIDLIKVCYHAGEKYGDVCACRKPRPGLLLEAATDLGIHLPVSFMVGDRWRDIECGRRAGCRTIFVDWGYDEALQGVPDFRAPDLLGAIPFVITPTLP
jgi:D-glycero-D-manno-heptose 1,7-bisphosphate phosphatase